MPTPTSPIAFKDLMQHVDKDLAKVNSTPHRRGRLEYSIKINDRQTEIIARSTLRPQNNRPRLTFIVRTPQKKTAFTSLYLSEIDIMDILSTLDNDLYEHIENYLVRLYRDEVNPEENRVHFSREALFSHIADTTLSADRKVFVIPDFIQDRTVMTPFGFLMSFRSFCDVLSLILSTENPFKLKVIITKYFVFSHLLRSQHVGVPVPQALREATTLDRIKEVYAGKDLTRIQQYDEATFHPDLFSAYFQKLR